MTALAAYVSFGADPKDARERCRAMLEAQARYATSSPALLTHDTAALGVAAHGGDRDAPREQGPIQGAEGRYTLAADIVIHDRPGWIRRLGIDQDAARTYSDAALLMLGWGRWQADALRWLNADFGFALWDCDQRALILARDFLGQKPLFFHRHRHWTACATMPSGLWALPDIPQAPDREALAGYITLAPPRGTGWYFEGVHRVPPGTIVRIDRDGMATEAHWPPPRTELTLGKPQDYIEATQEVFDRAVTARLGPDRLIGCHLSAGLDSSAVMASAARQGADDRHIVAFTAVPPDGLSEQAPAGRILDEGVLAGASAGAFANVEHVRIPSASDDPSAIWDKAFTLFQAPLPNPFNFLWGLAINDAAQARGIRSMLTGQVGNFSLSYSPGAYHANLLAAAHLKRLLREAQALRTQGAGIRSVLAKTLRPLSPPWLRRTNARLRGRPTDLNALCFPGLAARGYGADLSEDILYGAANRDSWADRVRALQALDFGVYNKGYLAGWGIEMQDPTADRDLVALCLSIPDEIFWHGGQSRALARGMLKEQLPAHVLSERRRGYQAADWRQSLSTGKARLLDETNRARNSVLSSDLLNIDQMVEALQNLDVTDAPRHTQTLKLRNGLIRATAAAHFIRAAKGGNY